MSERILTKGNVEVQNIKVGDIHYEFELPIFLKVKVLTLPKKNPDGCWVWKSENMKNGKIVDYLVNPEFPSYLSVNLYDYMAYENSKQI